MSKPRRSDFKSDSGYQRAVQAWKREQRENNPRPSRTQQIGTTVGIIGAVAGAGTPDLGSQTRDYGQNIGRNRANSERNERGDTARGGSSDRGNRTRGSGRGK